MAQPALILSDPREAIYQSLIASASGERNHDAIAAIYASWRCGLGAMPDWLGLEPAAFWQMMEWHFPGHSLPPAVRGADAGAPLQRSDEIEDLRTLLLGQRAGNGDDELWISDLLITGCMAADHLWQDLGLWNRRQLSALMERNFPRLAAANTKDMKWKKFLYKQLCDTVGVYTCRAPSCERCADYHACFGPEEA